MLRKDIIHNVIIVYTYCTETIYNSTNPEKSIVYTIPYNIYLFFIFSIFFAFFRIILNNTTYPTNPIIPILAIIFKNPISKVPIPSVKDHTFSKYELLLLYTISEKPNTR